MKKYLVILLVPLLFSCGREAKQKAVELQARNDSLVQQTVQKDQAINDFMGSVNDIQGLLDSIKTRENLITANTQKMGEMKPSMRTQMRSDITAIYALLLKDKERLDALSHKLKTSGIKLAEFQKMVDNLQQQIATKDADLADLRDKLAKMDIQIASANQKIDTLNNVVQVQGQEITQKTGIINEQTVALNTAYYILGTSKQLKDDKIVKGGKILPDFNRTLFTKVDIRNLAEIPIESKKAKLLSNHPSSSYKMNMEGKKVKSIEVTDGKAFWSNTKYLVVQID